MRATGFAALGAALALAACGGGGGPGAASGDRVERKCPVPVHYTKQQYDEIQKALTALPKDSILLQAMQDYEQERDDLRFCK
jgi:ABC-type glycerol-3-phosphate transport system substrate-binding protein